MAGTTDGRDDAWPILRDEVSSAKLVGQSPSMPATAARSMQERCRGRGEGAEDGLEAGPDQPGEVEELHEQHQPRWLRRTERQFHDPKHLRVSFFVSITAR
jgi:hypothetical protein